LWCDVMCCVVFYCCIVVLCCVVRRVWYFVKQSKCDCDVKYRARASHWRRLLLRNSSLTSSSFTTERLNNTMIREWYSLTRKEKRGNLITCNHARSLQQHPHLIPWSTSKRVCPTLWHDEIGYTDEGVVCELMQQTSQSHQTTNRHWNQQRNE
jgi:hypothetical protein